MAGMRGSVKVVVYYTAQDDPRKNTALKLEKARRATIVDQQKRIPEHAVLLNPFAKKAISREDLQDMRKNGLVALDCSWRQAESMFPTLQGKMRSRALPWLLAANPSKYGQPMELTTAEALAAALYIVGEKRLAKRTLAPLPFADRFWALNAEPLQEYADCQTSEEVVEKQFLFIPDPRDEEE